MNVIYDLLGFQSRDHGERGIARYVLNLALALERTNPSLVTQYLIDPRLPLPAGCEPLISSGKVVRIDRDDPARRPSAGGIFIAGSLFEMDESLDRVLPPWVRGPRWTTMAVLYDLIPLKFKDWYLQRADIRHVYNARSAAMADIDHLLAISQASADDAVEILGSDPSRITVIGAGADARFRRPDVSRSEVVDNLIARNRVPGLRPGYLLFPSGIERRKNIERTIEAYGLLPAEVRARHQLVLVCRIDDYARHLLANLAAEAGVTDQLLTTGFVDDDTLCQLYQGAELVVFPSIYEGFGLPVLEAMQCGAPVLCSDSSSLKEVQTLPEARFDPGSADAIAAALEHGLTDAGFRQRLRHQELPPFTWEWAAEQTAAAALELGRAQDRRRAGQLRPDRPRLGLVTPLPPQHSGIATYAQRLLEELRHHCDVTVFVDDGAAGEVTAPDGVAVAPLSHLDPTVKGGGAFDRLLYFMGNSRFHVEALAALRRHPGWVLLHDVRLTGLYSETHRLAPGRLVESSVGATLDSLYPDRYRPSVVEMASIPGHDAHRFGILMLAEVVDRAQQVLVHSGFGASLVELDTGTPAMVAYPLPCPDPGPAAEPDPAAEGAAPPRPIIATFGIVSPVKQPEAIVGALPTVLARIPDARLCFVGEVEAHHRAELTALARELGVEAALEFTDHLDDQGFLAAQRSASVAVQLRAVTNGESSAAVAELLALGVPTVVTDLGAMAELPDDAVVKVPQAVTGPDLGRVLVEVLTDERRRAGLAEGAVAYARANTFAQAAAVLAKLLFS